MSPGYFCIVCHNKKNAHYHGNIRTTNMASHIHIWHAHSTRFTEPRMSARHQREARTWWYQRIYMAAQLRGYPYSLVIPGTLRSSRQRLMQLLPLPIPTPWSCRCWHGCLTVVLAAAAVVVPRLYGLRMNADISLVKKFENIMQCSKILNNTGLIVIPLKSTYVVALDRQC